MNLSEYKLEMQDLFLLPTRNYFVIPHFAFSEKKWTNKSIISTRTYKSSSDNPNLYLLGPMNYRKFTNPSKQAYDLKTFPAQNSDILVGLDGVSLFTMVSVK